MLINSSVLRLESSRQELFSTSSWQDGWQINGVEKLVYTGAASCPCLAEHFCAEAET